MNPLSAIQAFAISSISIIHILGLCTSAAVVRAAVSSSHHYRHEHHRFRHYHLTPDPPDDDSSERLIQSEDNVKASATRKILLPTYLKLLYDQLSNEPVDPNTVKGDKAVDIPFRAVFPSSIQNDTDDMSIRLKFKLTNESLMMRQPDGLFSIRFIFTFIPEIQRDLLALEITAVCRSYNGVKTSNGTIQMDSRHFYSLTMTDLAAEDSPVIHLDLIIRPIFRRLQSTTSKWLDFGNELPFLLIQFRRLLLLSPRFRERRAVKNSEYGGEDHADRTGFQPSSPPSIVPLQQPSKVLRTGSNGTIDSERTSNNTQKYNDLSLEYEVHDPISQPGPEFCRRHSWIVDSHDVGWDNVVSSGKLDLGYCAGACPYPLLNEHFNFTLHALFLDRHRLMKSFMELPREFPRPCCVPVSYKELTVILQDGNDSVVFEKYKEASVESCGCR